MSKAAKVDFLEQLHAAVARVLTDAMSGEIDEEGNERPPSPQMIAQAIKFLKDNGVEPARDADHSALNKLQEQVSKIANADDEDIRDYLQ